MIEEIGYVKGPDGVFRGGGQGLVVSVYTSAETDIETKSTFAVAEFWQSVGVGVETTVVPPQRRRDREYQATRPGFLLQRASDGSRALRSAHSSQTPLAENNYQLSGNVARYINPGFDALLEKYFATVPWNDRLVVLGDIISHQTDQITIMPLLSSVNPNLVATRLKSFTPRSASEGTDTWNAHLWDLG